jgi:hypothetical protein
VHKPEDDIFDDGGYESEEEDINKLDEDGEDMNQAFEDRVQFGEEQEMKHALMNLFVISWILSKMRKSNILH